MTRLTRSLSVLLFIALTQGIMASITQAANVAVTIKCQGALMPPIFDPHLDRIDLGEGDTVTWTCDPTTCPAVPNGEQARCRVIIEAGVQGFRINDGVNPLGANDIRPLGEDFTFAGGQTKTRRVVAVPPVGSAKYTVRDQANKLPGPERKLFAHLPGWVSEKEIHAPGYWKDSDGVNPEKAGCHKQFVQQGMGCGAAIENRIGESCKPGHILLETNPGVLQCHAHANDKGHPDLYSCDAFCKGKYGADATGVCEDANAVNPPGDPNFCGANFASARCKCTVVIAQPNHFLCRDVKDLKDPKFIKVPGITVADQTGNDVCEAKKPAMLCNPVNKNNEGIPDPTLHYCCYKVKCTSKPVVNYVISDQFWVGNIATRKPRFICNPCTKVP